MSVAISNLTLGAGTGMRFASMFVLLTHFALHDAGWGKRWAQLVAYLVPLTTLMGACIFYANPSQTSLTIIASSCFWGVVMAIISYVLATLLRFRLRWSIRSIGEHARPAKPIGIARLMELTLIVSLGFAWYLNEKQQFQWSSVVLFYEFVFYGIPSMGMAAITCCLFRLFLSEKSGRKTLSMCFRILLANGAVLSSSVLATYFFEPAATGRDQAVLLISAGMLAMGMSGFATLAQIPMLFCLRMTGIRLTTRTS